MANQGYQPVDRYLEAWKLLARRWDWKPVVEDGELVAVMLPSRSDPGLYRRVNLDTLACACPDSVYRQAPRGALCAHGRAVKMAMTFRRYGWTQRDIVDLAEYMVAGL